MGKTIEFGIGGGRGLPSSCQTIFTFGRFPDGIGIPGPVTHGDLSRDELGGVNRIFVWNLGTSFDSQIGGEGEIPTRGGIGLLRETLTIWFLSIDVFVQHGPSR